MLFNVLNYTPKCCHNTFKKNLNQYFFYKYEKKLNKNISTRVKFIIAQVCLFNVLTIFEI